MSLLAMPIWPRPSMEQRSRQNRSERRFLKLNRLFIATEDITPPETVGLFIPTMLTRGMLEARTPKLQYPFMMG